MVIDCYLFSNIARKIDHIYYTEFDYGISSFFYYDLSDCNFESVYLNSFLYKVRIDSNDVFFVNKSGFRATKFQIIEEVNISDWIQASTLNERTKTNLKSIFNGSLSQEKVLNIYNKIITSSPNSLTAIQTFKIHAILSQKKYELPTLMITNENWRYLRIFEFYSREYDFSPSSVPFIKQLEIESYLGSKKFEYVENEDVEILMADMVLFSKLVLSRKLTQTQFENCCRRMIEIIPLLIKNYKKDFVRNSLQANYEIPHDTQYLFFPEIILKHPCWVMEMKAKDLAYSYDKDRLLLLGYKISDYNYTSYWSSEIKKARAIFKNENYQYIELDE